MKNINKFSLLITCTIFMISTCVGQININKISNKLKSQIPTQKNEGSSALSNDQVIKGLKEALNVGVNIGTRFIKLKMLVLVHHNLQLDKFVLVILSKVGKEKSTRSKSSTCPNFI